MLQKDATFYVDDFINDLCSLGMVMDFYTALHEAHANRNPYFAHNLYYKGKIKNRFPFFEKYASITDDDECLSKIDEDYDYLETMLLGVFSEFKMSLQKNKISGQIGIYADIDSVFDLC